MRRRRLAALPFVRFFASFFLVGMLLISGRAGGATRKSVLDAAVKAADRVPTVRRIGRNWEDVPYLVGLLAVAEEIEKATPDSGGVWMERVTTAVGGGDSPIANGDYAGYAQAAMDLYRLSSLDDAATRAGLLEATRGPLDFAELALHGSPSIGPPTVPWWVDGGYGTRFWVDDLFTLPPGLAMRGSRRDGLPGDAAARDLAYEWIESYLYDHRPHSTDAGAAAVPSQRRREGPLLWHPGLSLFRHDPGPGAENFWGRGNGWAAWGLARSAGYLEAPYGGGRYEEVVDRTGIREMLARFANALAERRSDDGGWPSDLAHPETCPASETSATGLLTYMLTKGVNEGWLDRAAFTPVVLKSLALLLSRIDDQGDLAGIQPPGTGPDCGVKKSNDLDADLSYGVGAFLLAASEAVKLPDGALAELEEAASRPVDRTPVGLTWVLAWAEGCDAHQVLLTNEGTRVAHARLEPGVGGLASRESTDVPPGRSVVLRIADVTREGPLVLTLRSDGDLTILPRASCGQVLGVEDGDRSSLMRLRAKRAGTAEPLWTALAPGEGTTRVQALDGILRFGGKNTSPGPASIVLEIISGDGRLVERYSRDLPPGGSVLEARFLSAGSRVVLSNASRAAGLVPLLFAQPR